jgi:hypothetical protein
MDFIYGDILPLLPPGFEPPEVWPEYGTIADPVAICAREEVGHSPKGMRFALGPICFEEYTGDSEPDVDAACSGTLARPRVVMWHRVRRTDKPPRWSAFSKKPWRIDGVIDLKPNVDYTDAWHKNARRDLRRWRELFAQNYSVERIALQEFAEAYKKSLIAGRVDLERLHQLERRFALQTKEHIELWAVRGKSGKIVAGTGIIYSPTYGHSTHFAPFITEEGRSVYAATALVDHWFAETIRLGCRFAVTTNFWFKGQPRGWKGFSEFKSHFGFDFVEYPPTLYRFVGGKLF